MTNIELFKFSGQHPEPIIDPYYNRDKVVIPPTVDQTNNLVEKNARLIELISVFSYFSEQGKAKDHPDVRNLIDEVITILKETDGINLSPFSQFFMVYNSSHNSFIGYAIEEQREFIYEMQNFMARNVTRCISVMDIQTPFFKLFATTTLISATRKQPL